MILDIPLREQLSIFIVHRHDNEAILKIKNYLQNTLRLPEPVILREQPSLGRTVLEKFEDYASESNLVFVLLTPDDIMDSSIKDGQLRRARQNVLFETGFFLGWLGRNGRVILLHKGDVEIPSDIAGLIYIDITSGVESVGEQIRREIHHLI